MFVGKRYKMTYRISPWVVKDQRENANIKGRLTIKSMTLRFRDTGFFQVEITPIGRPTGIQKFTGRRIGSVLINEAGIESNQEKFLVQADSKNTNIDIVSNSYLPLALEGYNFSGRFTPRTRST
jgi:hypothetical protein